MNYRRLLVQGFRTYQKPQEVCLDGQPFGFYLVTGENQVMPDLGPNDVGKSSMWDALCWVFYGKTARGLRASAVQNWESGDVCTVQCEFEERGEVYVLTRTHDPNTLTLETTSGARGVTQDEVDAIIGLDYETFLNVVLMGQFNEFFFDLEPSAKLAHFSKVLDLDYWLNASKRVSKEAGSREQAVRDLERKDAELAGKLQSLASQLEAAEVDVEEWEVSRVRMIGKWTIERNSHQDLADKARRELDEISARELQAGSMLTEVKEKTRTVEKDYRDLDRQLDLLELKFQSVGGRLKRLKAEVDESAPLLCPTCHQSLGKDLADERRSAIDRELRDLEGQRKEHEKELAILRSRLPVLKQELDQLAKEADLFEQEHRSLTRSHLTTAADHMRFSTKGEEAVRQIAYYQSAENPHRATVDRLERQQTAVAAERLELKERLDEARQRLEECRFWTTHFRRIRLWLIEEALTELEIEINNVLIQLGLRGWKVTFDVERENSSGGVTRGFQVTITSPTIDEPLPWKAWGGGVTQRLRVAGAIGWARLIESRRGIRTNLEVWDEPDAHMSEQGVNDLLNYFQARSQLLNRQIYWVSHRSLGSGAFDGELKVVKTEFGSRIQDLR